MIRAAELRASMESKIRRRVKFAAYGYPAHDEPVPLAAPFRASMALTGLARRLFQNALADGPEHDAEHPSLETVAVAYDHHVDVGQTIGTACEGVGAAGRAFPLCWSRPS